MIRCHLARILKERKIFRNKFAQEAGLAHTTVRGLYDDTWKTIDRATIDRVCRTLDVPINELIEIVPDSELTEKRDRHQVPIHQYKKGKEA